MKFTGIIVSLLLVTNLYGLNWNIEFEYRFRQNYLSDIPVNESGGELNQNLFGENRLRISPYLSLDDLKMKVLAEADFLTGLNYGDEPYTDFRFAEIPRNNRDGISKIDFRQLYFQWLTPYGLLKIGQMTSEWGYGIMANGGSEENLFGDSYLGDLVDRVEFVTTPFALLGDSDVLKNLYIAIGGDFVYRDDLGSVLEGDKAFQGIFAGLYRDESYSGGYYIAYRNQKDNAGNGEYEILEGTGYDIFFSAKPRLGENVFIEAGFEGVILTGRTTMLLNYNNRNGVKVKSGGAVARVGFDFKDYGIRPLFETGVASGDGNLNDGTLYAYKFDPNYNVGIVLFDEVLNAVTASSAERAGDPEKLGSPPPGVKLLPSNGSITNAVYFMPTISYTGINNIKIDAGVLVANALEDITDPYLTFKNGGTPRTFLDISPRSKQLGSEVDLGISYTYKLKDLFKIITGIQYGQLFPGRFFTTADGSLIDPVYKLQGRITIKR